MQRSRWLTDVPDIALFKVLFLNEFLAFFVSHWGKLEFSFSEHHRIKRMTNTFHLQELTRSLKQVGNSKEEATDEFERLRDKKEEMEAQFAALQQLISSVRTF